MSGPLHMPDSAVRPRPRVALKRDELEVACALIRAVRDGAQLVNLSLGTQTQYDQPSLALRAALEVVHEIEVDRGEEVLVVAAAGNFGDTAPVWPAAFKRVISVGALTADLRPSAFSSRGWWVDCSTVGEGILSTFVSGEQSPDFTSVPESIFVAAIGTSPRPSVSSGAHEPIFSRSVVYSISRKK